MQDNVHLEAREDLEDLNYITAAAIQAVLAERNRRVDSEVVKKTTINSEGFDDANTDWYQIPFAELNEHRLMLMFSFLRKSNEQLTFGIIAGLIFETIYLHYPEMDWKTFLGYYQNIVPSFQNTYQDEGEFDLNFRGSSLQGADLRDTQLNSASFNSALLCSAKLPSLDNVSFYNADLQGASFEDANLRNVNFDRANLTGARFDVSSVTESTFDNARGILDPQNFYGNFGQIPSIIDQFPNLQKLKKRDRARQIRDKLLLAFQDILNPNNFDNNSLVILRSILAKYSNHAPKFCASIQQVIEIVEKRNKTTDESKLV